MLLKEQEGPGHINPTMSYETFMSAFIHVAIEASIFSLIIREDGWYEIK